MKNNIIVTGGAGFIGTNLIKLLLLKTKFRIISIDNYSTGKKKNHIKNKRVKYVKGNTLEISSKLKKYKNKINCLFHFGEFARIHQSFEKIDECISSNTCGSNEVFKFCKQNNIKLIYSATSASLGNSGNDKNLSPYAFTKSKNLEMLNNLKKWFNFKFEVIYFYNVYGPNQISSGGMATVIGIFEEAYKKNKPLPVVKPGTQTRRFTHVNDTVKTCYYAWKKNNNSHYIISNKKSFSIYKVAKLFGKKIKYLPERKGERYVSALNNLSFSDKVFIKYGKIDLKDYIKDFKIKFNRL